LATLNECRHSGKSAQNDYGIDEQSWYLNEVVFVEDAKASNILGKVVKIDADYVLVKMQTSEGETSSSQDLLENSRIFPKSQLQVVKTATAVTGGSGSGGTSSSPQLPDFSQKSLKKLSDIGEVLTTAAQHSLVHAIVHKESSLFYVQYDLFNNKLVKEKRISTSLAAFMGQNVSNIRLFTIDDPNVSCKNKPKLPFLVCIFKFFSQFKHNMPILTDGNATFYPLIDLPGGSNQFKDPQWKQMFPVKCFSQTLLSTGSGGLEALNNNRKLDIVTLFAMKVQQLMTCILRADVNKVTKILKQLEDGNYLIVLDSI
jgi:hypothetical protein